ncbi:organomercurial lyase [Sphingopyxis sp. SE2]|uniref:organomercurial lyase n=1 Tax=Sphingopyxis sp. SE2 TaxID=1586240 RepID=UPI0028C03818|nr:organomercurial lyase [Sphingopyxis sp. SE2]MDT7531460.1 organomercurial lyase [Sphingopyxis sp. SE2]
MIDELLRRLPTVPAEDQRTGILLLHELAKGQPIGIAQLAELLGTGSVAAEAFVRDCALSPFVLEEDGRIHGFWGLSVRPTHHRVRIKGRKLWVWCAVDTLLYPELFGETVEIETRDPETHQMNRLTVSPTRIEAAEPAGIIVSMVRPRTADFSSNPRLRASACHFIFFFGSRASGERWQVKHSGTVLLSLEEAFAFARGANARVFGAEVARRRAYAS